MGSGSGAGMTDSACASCAWKAKRALARHGSAWSAFCGRVRMHSTHPSTTARSSRHGVAWTVLKGGSVAYARIGSTRMRSWICSGRRQGTPD
eukprot:7755759-Pyramimonas_sp.AAC.1